MRASRIAIVVCWVLLVGCSVDPDFGSAPIDDDGFSVAGSLELIPARALEPGAAFRLSMADVDAAAQIAGVQRPAEIDDTDAAADYLRVMSGRSGERRANRVFVAFPTRFGDLIHAQAEIFEDFGFVPTDFSSFVEVSGLAMFVVASGVELKPGLPQVAPGVFTVGEGDDMEIKVDERTAFRNLGRPHRVASRDGHIAVGFITDTVAAWQTGEARTVADTGQVTVVAELLDEADVVSAMLFGELGATYNTVGMGWTVDESGPLVMLVMSYRTDAAAIENMDRVTAGFTAPVGDGDQRVSDQLSVESIERRDSEIIARLRYPEDGRPDALISLLLTVQGPFA